MTCVLISRPRGHAETHTHGDGHVRLEAEMGVTQLQAQDCRQLPELRRRPPPQGLQGNQPADILILNFQPQDCESKFLLF